MGAASPKSNTASWGRDRPALVGLIAGLSLGIADYFAFGLIGIDIHLEGREVSTAFFAFFALTYGALGYTIGRIWTATRRLRRNAVTIDRQLRALEASERQVVQHEKLAAVGRLAAGVAHEVRNPLGVIRSSAELLRNGLSESDRTRAGQFIVDEVDRLNRFVTELLDFSRPTTVTPARISLTNVLDAAIRLGRNTFKTNEVEIIAPSVDGPTVEADPDLLTQVALGLLTNAAQAVDRGGRVSIRWVAEPHALGFEIADNGPGVPDANQNQLFEPFFTTKADGTGLGLAMAKRVVDGHGGRINLIPGAGSGADGTGACFRVLLPVVPPVNRSGMLEGSS